MCEIEGDKFVCMCKRKRKKEREKWRYVIVLEATTSDPELTRKSKRRVVRDSGICVVEKKKKKKMYG